MERRCAPRRIESRWMTEHQCRPCRMSGRTFHMDHIPVSVSCLWPILENQLTRAHWYSLALNVNEKNNWICATFIPRIPLVCLHPQPQRHNHGGVIFLATVGRIGYVPYTSHNDHNHHLGKNRKQWRNGKQIYCPQSLVVLPRLDSARLRLDSAFWVIFIAHSW